MRAVKPVVQFPARRTLRSTAALAGAGLIGDADRAGVDAAAAALPVAITPEMAALIDRFDPADPIARQFVPDRRELEFAPSERADPIGDELHSPVKGIVHRHANRVLLMPVMTCPVYCRFCFRREAVGPDGGALNAAELDAALGYIRHHEEIWEVILSGGDPLVLLPRRLGGMIEALDRMDHVAAIRIHSRVPAVDPGRITAALVAALQVETPVHVVLHCNHAREITPAARHAIAALVSAGIPLLSQTVLLKGVNDDVETLSQLMRTMVQNRVTPYYLHHADLARGTAHFRTSLEAGRALVRELRVRLSGLCQPTYVLDIPGGHGKVPVGPDYVVENETGDGWYVIDLKGIRHAYPPQGAQDDAAALPRPGQADRFRRSNSAPSDAS